MWVHDFLTARDDVATDVSVLEKDFTAGPDSGMVVVSLRNASTMTYVQAIVRDGMPRWLVTFEARNESFDLDAAGVARLAHDLSTLAQMCDYLQERTDAALAAKAAAAPV
ncbi:protein-L-isoaspartate carboxylmethyltransferase [Microbacterium sp. SS28]|uniref:protein-L-isoaspartate carboxylmethyltransferase n=1 Tax=Microbacterium sp. SS28 TaxID=2919948 RepID=UPI001FA95DE7|nr:protein-L-isoaspartate carboxylmethyltransferase [Microbacterium sp. SS28]